MKKILALVVSLAVIFTSISVIFTGTAAAETNANLAADYTVANGHVVFDGPGVDAVNVCDKKAGTDLSQYSYAGGYAWRVKFKKNTAKHNDAGAYENNLVNITVKATALEANTTYKFAYIGAGDYGIEFVDVRDPNGLQVTAETATLSNLTDKDPLLNAYQVGTAFTTDAAGDYTINLRTSWYTEYCIQTTNTAAWGTVATATNAWYGSSLTDLELFAVGTDTDIDFDGDDDESTTVGNLLANTSKDSWLSSVTGQATQADTADNTALFKVFLNHSSVYTKVTLKADTAYNFSVNHKGTTIKTIRLIAVNDPNVKTASGAQGAWFSSDGTTGNENVYGTSYVTAVTPGKVTNSADLNVSGAPNSANGWYSSNWLTTTATMKTSTATEYYLVIDGTWSIGSAYAYTYTSFKDFSLVETVIEEDKNMAADYTMANGSVVFTSTYNRDDGTYDANGNLTPTFNVKDDLTSLSYNGGYAWRPKFAQKSNPAEYIYVTIHAKNLAANTKYSFSYIGGSDAGYEFVGVKNSSGADVTSAVESLDNLKDKGQILNAYQMLTNFTTTEAGDYTIHLKTSYSHDHFITGTSEYWSSVATAGCNWYGPLLTDLELYKYDERPVDEDEVKIDLDCKNNATIVPTGDCDMGSAKKGSTYTFNVITEPGLTPTVTVNGQTLTETNGVYSFVVKGETTIKINCGSADDSRPKTGEDYYGNDLTKYDSETYLTNIWEGDTVYHETALFYTGRNTVQLLYPVDEVISLRSYSLNETYIKGVDFDITSEGYIKILSGSRIPVYAGALTTTTKPAKNAFPLRDNANEYVSSIGDSIYAQYAIAVTYKHSKTFENGYTPTTPESQVNSLSNTITKLKNGETVNIVVYGDSISCGWSSSGLNAKNVFYDKSNTEGNFINHSLNVAPYAPTWIDMVITELGERYPNATINVKNLSFAGEASTWGSNNIATRLALWKDDSGKTVTPDLIMVGFGVNDLAGNCATSIFKSNLKGIADKARRASGNSDMEVLYYSPFLPNQLTDTWDKDKLLAYENAIVELAEADTHTAAVKLTSIFSEIIKSKAAVDYLSTNWNHGNDFTCRQYATAILAAFKGEVTGDPDNLLKDMTSSDWTVTSRGYIGTNPESHSGTATDAVSVVKVMWRSAYTEFKRLDANKTYDLSFWVKETDSANVSLRYLNFGYKDDMNLSADVLGNIITSYTSTKDEVAAGEWYQISFTFKTTKAGTYIFGFTGFAANGQNNNEAPIYLSDFSLKEFKKDISGLDANDLLAGKDYMDWQINSRGTVNPGTEYYSDSSDAMSVYRMMYRTIYTTVDLVAGQDYKFSFYYKEDNPDEVYLAPGYSVYITTDKDLNKTTEGNWTMKSGGNNLGGAILTGVASDKDGWYMASVRFTANESTTYYVCINAVCTDGKVNSEALIHFSDLKLSKVDAEVYGNIEDKTVFDWYSITRTSLGTCSESAKGGNSFSADKLRFRTIYTGLNLKAKTYYVVTFYYKELAEDTYLTNIGVINKEQFSYDDGKANCGSLVTDSTDLTENTAGANGWKMATATFRTTTAGDYYLYLTAESDTNKDSVIYFSDFTMYAMESEVVYETNVSELYCEMPLNVLNNEGFENATTSNDWGTLPSTASIVSGSTPYGKKFLRVKAGTFFVLPVKVEDIDVYYFAATIRGSGNGYIGISRTADGRTLYADKNGNVVGYFSVGSGKTGYLSSGSSSGDNLVAFSSSGSSEWERSGFRFCSTESGIVYLVISCTSGSFDLDNLMLYKDEYALEEDPNTYTEAVPYNYDNLSSDTCVFNGGFDENGEIILEKVWVEIEDDEDDSDYDEDEVDDTEDYEDEDYDDYYDEDFDDEDYEDEDFDDEDTIDLGDDEDDSDEEDFDEDYDDDDSDSDEDIQDEAPEKTNVIKFVLIGVGALVIVAAGALFVVFKIRNKGGKA